MKVKRWAYDYRHEMFESVPDGNWVDYKVHVAQMRELKQKLKSCVWLLYMVDYENRSGEDFVHAFVGFPSYEELYNVIKFSEEDYALLKAGKETTGFIKYFMREQ